MALEAKGRIPEALAAADRAVILAQELFGAEHDIVGSSLRRRAGLREARGDFAGAIEDRERAVTVQVALTGKESWQSTDARLDLAELRRRSSLGEAQRESLRRAGELKTRAITCDRPGKHGEGAELAERALALYRATLGEDAREVAACSSWAGHLCSLSERPEDARRHFDAAVAVYARVCGDAHPELATALIHRARFARKQGDLATALSRSRQALDTRRKALGENDLETAMAHHEVALIHHQRGDYAAARSNHDRHLAIHEKVVGPDHIATADALNNLGFVHQHLGDFTAALACYERALRISEKNRDPRRTALYLNNLAGLLVAQGDESGAVSLYERALEIRRKVLGEDHAATAVSLNNLGASLAARGDHAAARRHHEQALGVLRLRLGEDHPETIACLNNLAYCLARQGDLAGARARYQDALERRTRSHGADHPELANLLDNLAGLAAQQADFAAARPLFEHALAIRKKGLGDEHPDTATSLTHLGTLAWRDGDLPTARSHYAQALAVTRKTLELASASQSERQQLAMAASLASRYGLYLSVLGDTVAERETAYALTLAWKGSVFSRQHRLRALRSEGPASAKLNELREVSDELATVAFQVPPLAERDRWRQRLAELTTKKEQLERELARQAPRGGLSAPHDVKPGTLHDQLPAQAALVDVVVYRRSELDADEPGGWTFRPHLAAFIVRHGRPIERIELGPMHVVTDLVQKWRAQTKVSPGKEGHPGQALRRTIWSPLEKHLEGASVVLLAPDGALGRFPFAALPGSGAGRYLIEERAIVVVPAPQRLPELLASVETSRKGTPSLLLLGDVDFDADLQGGSANDEGRKAPLSAAERRLMWSPIGGTRGEILAVRDTFEVLFPEARVKVLRGAQATEANVRAAAPQCTHLHFATHGFFAPEEIRSALAETGKERRAGDLFGSQGIVGFHPGLLSGLVLAGANRPPRLNQGDGILTALEVAEMDLHNVELAVLSACETGLGPSAAGEGLLGLQRAFQVAGARSVVATLWSVEDTASRSLMEQFYDNLWKKKLSRADALRQAQIWMLREGPRRGIVRLDGADSGAAAPPFYWAAFILSGDWR